MPTNPALYPDLAAAVMADRKRAAEHAQLVTTVHRARHSTEGGTDSQALVQLQTRLRRMTLRVAVVAAPVVYLLVETAGCRHW